MDRVSRGKFERKSEEKAFFAKPALAGLAVLRNEANYWNTASLKKQTQLVPIHGWTEGVRAQPRVVPPHLPGGAEYSIVKDLNQVNPRSGGRGTIPMKGKTPTDATAVKLI
jgi:hypothetical protein